MIRVVVVLECSVSVVARCRELLWDCFIRLLRPVENSGEFCLSEYVGRRWGRRRRLLLCTAASLTRLGRSDDSGG